MKWNHKLSSFIYSVIFVTMKEIEAVQFQNVFSWNSYFQKYSVLW